MCHQHGGAHASQKREHGCASMEWAPLYAHETQALFFIIIWFGTRDLHLTSRVTIHQINHADSNVPYHSHEGLKAAIHSREEVGCRFDWVR